MTQSDPDIVEAHRLFEELEERFRRCVNDDVGFLTDTIRLAERTLQALDLCTLDVSVMRDFAQYYLAMSLNYRGVARGIRLITTRAEDPESPSTFEAVEALADIDKSEAMAGGLGYLKGAARVDRKMQLALLLELGLYSRALTHVQRTIEQDSSSPDGYCELASVYRRMSDHERALQAANEAVRRAGNDHWRCETLRCRAGVYRALGDETSADRDLANAEHLLR